MERRTFIGAALAALAAPFLPAAQLAAPAPELAVWNIATLTEALRKRFVCTAGPAMAFFEVSKKTGEIIPVVMEEKQHPRFPNPTYTEPAELAEDHKRYIYQTYACAIEGGSAQEAEARLAKHFYDEFSKLPAGPLVWRVEPQFSSDPVIKWGETFLTREQVEDGFLLPNIPQNVELDPMTGSYKYVVEKTQLHKMRMRLVLPHLYDSTEETPALPSLFKPEGALITRMI